MITLSLYSHQDALELSKDTLEHFHKLLLSSLPLILKNHQTPQSLLPSLDTIEINCIDDATIERLHRDFMDIEGPTDVITFHHGEIFCSVETAFKQAENFAKDWHGELFIYMLHGILHLAGHDDHSPEEFATMDSIQNALFERFWHPLI